MNWNDKLYHRTLRNNPSTNTAKALGAIIVLSAAVGAVFAAPFLAMTYMTQRTSGGRE